MKNLVLIAILATLTLGGCSTVPGVYNGLSGDPWTMFSPGRGDGKPLEASQCLLLDTIAHEELVVVKSDLSSPVEAAASNAFPYGLTGAGGGGIIDKVSAISAGVIGFTGGAFSGLQVYSYSAVWQVWERICHRLEYLKSIDDPRVKSLFITAAFVRAKNERCKSLIAAQDK